MTDPLELILAELRLLRECYNALLGEFRAGKLRAAKRQRTVARRAADRVQSVAVTELDQMKARKELRRRGLL